MTDEELRLACLTRAFKFYGVPSGIGRIVAEERATLFAKEIKLANIYFEYIKTGKPTEGIERISPY